MFVAIAFALPGNAHRIRIRQVRWEAGKTPLPISALSRAVYLDDAARCNYHLRGPAGHFVEGIGVGDERRGPGATVVFAGSFTLRRHRPIDMASPGGGWDNPLSTWDRWHALAGMWRLRARPRE